ncbi:LPS export ABC transporter permease LptF [Roseicitreum antarcticum]|uniref:Lipopolysaccharide export system permease protein n=1 Tax=Roseicitreum antarcticum TaxID=564137 RepID=A0A1H2XVE7_9RHOB|nr:LPS export ABC transporter permease LptF [Roseicitreum antarcticum]SDW96548.1 lipopolysaccharide export system permease protein [Roseicitreum antarcticum]
MARVDKYLLTQLLLVFGFFSLVLVSVYWVNRAVSLFDRLIGDGQSVWVFLEFTALTLPNVIRVVLPVSAFAASVYVAQRLTRDSEMVVMQAAGVSPWRLMGPVALFGGCVAVFLLVLMHVLMPAARVQLAERQAQIAENITARFLTAGEFLYPASGITLYIRSLTELGELRDVFLSDARGSTARVDYTAETAVLVPGPQGPKLVMIDGMVQVLDRATGRLSTTRFDDLTYDVGALIGPAGRGGDVREFSTPELIAPPRALLDQTGVTLGEVRYELATRFAHPALAVVTALIGFAAILVGGFSRLGLWRQVLGGVVALAVVQLAGNATTGLATSSPAYAGLAFVPVAVGLVLVWAMLFAAGGGLKRWRRRGSAGEGAA